MISLYDSEIIAAEKVLGTLRLKQGRAVDLDAFQREAKDRFFRAGLIVDVKVFSTNKPGGDLYAFDIEILDRVDNKSEFDHDRMVHEVTSDILGLGTGGVIKSTKEDARRAIETERAHKRCGSTSCNHKDHG